MHCTELKRASWQRVVLWRLLQEAFTSFQKLFALNVFGSFFLTYLFWFNRNPQEFPFPCKSDDTSVLCVSVWVYGCFPVSLFVLPWLNQLALTLPLQHHTCSADYKEDDGSDDNRSSSLGRSAQSDDASLASDNPDDGTPECKLTVGI